LRKPIDAWMNFHAVAILVGAAVAVTIESPVPLAATAFGSFCYFLACCYTTATAEIRFGQMGNWITGIRLILILIVVVLMDEFSPYLVFTFFAVNLLLDVADGYVARKLGQASYFGAVFDQEVDAFFVMSACLYFNLESGFAPWILIPGTLRYAFRVTVWICETTEFTETRRSILARLAGLNFVLLTVAVILPPNTQFGLLVLSTGLFVASFSSSFRELLKTSNDYPLSR